MQDLSATPVTLEQTVDDTVVDFNWKYYSIEVDKYVGQLTIVFSKTSNHVILCSNLFIVKGNPEFYLGYQSLPTEKNNLVEAAWWYNGTKRSLVVQPKLQ